MIPNLTDTGMLSMRVDNLIDSLVSTLLVDEGGRDGEGLLFSLDLRMDAYPKEVRKIRDELHARNKLEMLYYLPKGYSYVNAFSRLNGGPWKHECTHDSCWRNLRVFSKVYFDMAELLNEQLKESGQAEMAPGSMHEHNTFNIFKPAFRWVPVEVTKDPKDATNYRRILTLK